MLIAQKNHYEYYDLTCTPKVFVDLDGTLFDFYRYFSHVNYSDMKAKGISISEISTDNYRKKASIRKYIHAKMSNQRIDYWARVPKTKCADILWNGIKQLKPSIFTGVIESDDTMQMGKLKWCRKRSHLNFKNADLSRVLFNATRTDFARNVNCPNILIDDDPTNCLEWEMAGGISYYYIDNAFVVDRIVNEVRNDIIRHRDLDFLLKWDDKLGRYIF